MLQYNICIPDFDTAYSLMLLRMSFIGAQCQLKSQITKRSIFIHVCTSEMNFQKKRAFKELRSHALKSNCKSFGGKGTNMGWRKQRYFFVTNTERKNKVNSAGLPIQPVMYVLYNKIWERHFTSYSMSSDGLIVSLTL